MSRYCRRPLSHVSDVLLDQFDVVEAAPVGNAINQDESIRPIYAVFGLGHIIFMLKIRDFITRAGSEET